NAQQANDFSDSWRPVQYLSQTAAAINPAADTDFYRYQFTAGDLVTVDIHPTSTGLRPRVNLLNASGTVIVLESGSPAINDREPPIYPYITPSPGAYYVQVSGLSGTGTYEADVYLSTDTPPPPPSFGYDYYSFSLLAGESATLAVKGQTGTNVNLELL